MMPGKVLIVDDDQAMCEMLNSDLRRRGFAPTWYTRSEKALASIHQEEYDVILADINMPGMTGIELLKKVKEQYHQLKVSMITAYADEHNFQEARKHGCDEYFTKPLDFVNLKQKILGDSQISSH